MECRKERSMATDQDTPITNALQRLDLALAMRVAEAPPQVCDLTEGLGLPAGPAAPRCQWVAGLLGLRGLQVHTDDVQAVIDCDEGRFGPEHHEYALIAGLLRVFDRLASPGVGVRRAPDGWILMELFKEFVGSVARFRDHYVRQDSPWDAILYVEYPDSSQLNAYLDGFNVDSSYMDNRMRFEKLHPVRQAFRVMWHFARIAPFPDFNITMAWVAMDMYLLHAGYPMVIPEPGDRTLLHGMMTGPVPLRIQTFERRLLGMLEG